MSSRRKSRPVRRLDSASGELISRNLSVSDSVFEEGPYDASLPTPEDSPVDQTLLSFKPMISHSENDAVSPQSTTVLTNDVNTRKGDGMPEGVYVLEPEGVSEDENQESKNLKNESAKSEDNAKFDFHPKKRQLAEFLEERKKEGLDLTSKRRKTDEDVDGNSEEIQNHLPKNEYQNNLERFEKFVKFIAAKRNLAEDNHEVKSKVLTSSPSLQSQYSVTASQPSVSEAASGVEHNQQSVVALSSLWGQQAKEKNSASWANTDSYAALKGFSTAPQSLSPTIPPAVAAAMMATWSTKKDFNQNDTTPSSEVLQTLFKQSQSKLQQQLATPVKKQGASGEYSTSPDAMDTITAGTVSSGVGSIKKGTLDPTNFDEEVFDKYISRFNASNSCMQASCPHINRDHYHCTDSDCNFQRFTNKSDVIRHYNMHKKRDNSLAHGFMRFAPTDNCQGQFGDCHLNGKSTHYHCLHSNCTRVYTSTSDVMTHENFHKKNQHFVTNGFQRYRATETCDADYCPFRNQRTTHFHCTRKGCNFTFKNKCDIDKHKSYHMRDDAYARQGFKKFYKNEPCHFPSCAWNRTANHFHCLRPNCDFAFTSTGQMVSHKRKHDRQDLLNAERGTSTSLASSSVGNLQSTFSRFPLHQRFSSPMVRALHSGSLTPSYLRAPKSNVFRSFPFLHPLLGASLLRRPSTSMGLEAVSSISPGAFGSFASIREAAQKVLGAVPPSPALVPLPKLGNFEQPEMTGHSLKSSPTSPCKPTENHSSEETTTDGPAERSGFFSERPPPPYLEGPLNMSNRNSLNYGHEDRSPGNSAESELADWPSTSQRHSVVTSPVVTSESGSEVLNLSNKIQQEPEPIKKIPELITAPSSLSMLKYFRKLEPGKCNLPNCAFTDRYHFHCIVQDCFAAFTDKLMVINHTLFHDNLEKLGVSQQSSNKFSSFLPIVTPQEPPSAAAGYLALPVSGSPNFVERGLVNRGVDVDADRRDCKFYPSSHDLTPSQKEEEEDPAKPSEVNIPATEAQKSERPKMTPHDARTAVYEYISRIMRENKPMASYLLPHQSGPSTTIGNTPYVTLQNPATVSSFVRSQSLPENKGPEDGYKPLVQPPSDGYIHIRAGSACIRADCKYVLQNHWHCTLNRCRYVCKSLAKAQSHRQAHDSLEAYARAAKECFKSYTVKKNCPNPNCEFRLRGHYHCLKPGCQFVTIGTSKLPWHMKKHEKIARREASGFKYYTKKDQCGRKECKYNGMFSHYHCIRAGCSFAFQYKHQMSTHVRKHLRRMLGRSYSGADVPAEAANVDHSNVDSGDDSLPLIVDEADELEQRPGASMETSQASLIRKPQAFQSFTGLSKQQKKMLEQISKRGFELQQAYLPSLPDENLKTGANHEMDENANVFDRANEDADDISSTDGVLDLRASTSIHDTDSNSNSSTPTAALNNETLTNSDQVLQEPDYQHSMALESNLSKPSFRSDDNRSLFSKFRLNNDVISGFKRCEISEDCGDADCNFKHKVSHYHCLHEDCNYRFTSRAHMFKHSQHHERVAGLVRDDFKRFRPNQNCQYDDCTFNGSSTHFHCLRCQFKCTDSAKVGAHRRHHVKADTLEQSGFERFRGKDDCKRDTCRYRNRNTSHFHCLQPGCSYAVVGLSGIEQHAKKHKTNEHHQLSDQVNFSIVAKSLHQPELALNPGLFADRSFLANSGHVINASGHEVNTSNHVPNVSPLSASSLLTYSVPFTALCTSGGVAHGTDVASPGIDRPARVSPHFESPVVTSKLESSQIKDKPDVPFINLSSLAMKREISGGGV